MCFDRSIKRLRLLKFLWKATCRNDYEIISLVFLYKLYLLFILSKSKVSVDEYFSLPKIQLISRKNSCKKLDFSNFADYKNNMYSIYLSVNAN